MHLKFSWIIERISISYRTVFSLTQDSLCNSHYCLAVWWIYIHFIFKVGVGMEAQIMQIILTSSRAVSSVVVVAFIHLKTISWFKLEKHIFPSVVRRKAMVQFQTASLTSIKIWSWLWSWTTPGPLQSLLYSSSCWESREHFKFECMLYHLPSIRYRFSGSQGLCHLIMVNFGWPNIGLYLFIIYYYYLFLKVFLPFKF